MRSAARPRLIEQPGLQGRADGLVKQLDRQPRISVRGEVRRLPKHRWATAIWPVSRLRRPRTASILDPKDGLPGGRAPSRSGA